MSAVQTNPFTGEERYIVYRSRPLNCWIVSDTAGDYRGAPYKLADAFKTESAARYAIRLLNSGLARIEEHRTIGCRIVAS